MSASRIVAVIIGGVLALTAIGLIFAGVGLVTAAAVRSKEGVVWSDPIGVATPRYAVTGDRFHIRDYPGEWLQQGLIDLRLEVATTNGKPLFAGVGPAPDVDRYLGGVGHDVAIDFGGNRPKFETKPVEGSAPPSPPADQKFWVASTASPAGTPLIWSVVPGDWSVVILNADASAGIAGQVRVGAYLPFLAPIGGAILAVGLLLAAAATFLLVWATRSPRGRDASGASGAGSVVVAPVYPAALEGHLDPNLSRWMWLVKWLLAIPHFIVLSVLWITFGILTVVAFFAILINGRYPRSIFDFNVGVLRWSWRVAFYAFNPAATDRYPPFSLKPQNYPARFDVAYPEQLSRGLALVKWWLLAIPHYVIVALFTNGLIWWVNTPAGDSAALRVGGGLMGILVAVALIALLVTGRYLGGLFDLIMGLNRWVFRVIAYAALMCDEYPPFRIDLGGDEPRAIRETPRPGIGQTGTRPAY